MLHSLIYHFISHINVRPLIRKMKPYPCYYDEKYKKMHYCTCVLQCKYKEYNKLIKLCTKR